MARGGGAGCPGWVGGGLRGTFEEGGRFGEGLGEETELGGEELRGGGGCLWWVGRLGGGGVGEGEVEEVDGLREERVEGGQGPKVDWVVLVDGEGLMRESAQAEVDCLG